MASPRSLKNAHFLALIVPAVLLAGAYVSQYVFGLPPCEMCWWQRYPHFAAVLLALIGFFAAPSRRWIMLAAFAILISGLIGAFHAGVEYDWWEGITSCSTVNLGDGDPLEAIMNAPFVRCDTSPWDLFGISLAGWNFFISVGAALTIFTLLRKKGS